MKTKKLNCIRARARRKLPRAGGLLALFLLAVLLVTPALADGEIPKESLANKPEVTIQGNVVIDDNGNPTGFYELALCVRSPKRIVGPDPSAFNTVNGTTVLKTDLPIVELSETQYAQVLVDIYQDDPALMPTAAQDAGITEEDYTVTYYPFTAASAVVNVNVDALTPVHWDVETVTYGTWDSTSKTYTDTALDTAYPRGVDVSALDPEVWGMTAPDAFPDVRKARAVAPGKNRVYLDAEGDRSALTAAAVAEHYYTSGDIKAAVITLSAHVGDNKPVIYTKSTPVVVVRFAYDLNRFPKAAMEWNETFNRNNTVNQITGKNDPADAEGFWLGLDRNTTRLGTLFNDGKTPVTWLSDSGMTDPKAEYSYSDYIAAHTDAGQVAWAKYATEDTDGSSVDWDETEYYYYLGATATGNIPDGEGSAIVSTPTGDKVFDHVRIPSTEGYTVLAEGTARNPDPITDPTDPNYDDEWTATAPYSYYENLLYLDGDHSLQLRLINDISFKTGASKGLGGNQILFYDWDDTLIGSLIVGDGDVRQAVNDYIENNLVHPDLRAGEILKNDLGGTMPDFTSVTPSSNTSDGMYVGIISSREREFTYRGKYPSTPQPAGTVDGTEVADGEEYPLTNKLDYVFYKHLNTITTGEWENTTTGKKWTEDYYTLNNLTADPVAAQYPWAFGWAVVEDVDNAMMPDKKNWPLMYDAKKTEGVWTTFKVGELVDQDPSAGYVPLPAATLPETVTMATPIYPSVDGDWSTDAGKDPNNVGYTYKVSSADANGYLRFADFSDTAKLFKDGQDVIIVKAVYEPGVSLNNGGNYSTIDGTLNIERYGTNASFQDSVYSFQYQYERASSNSAGYYVGVNRTRDPAIQTGYTYDVKVFGDEMDPRYDTSVFFLKNLAENKDIMDIDITTSGSIWNLKYYLVDLYGRNLATGRNRSVGDEWKLKSNFNYDDWTYSERQGSDGFVVEATLNTLCAEATKTARGEDGQFAQHFTYETCQDLNLCTDRSGTPMAYAFVSDSQKYIQDLVSRIVADYPDPESASAKAAGIYDKNGYVKLGWHQIQEHILLCEAAGAIPVPGIYSGGVLKSEEDCKAIGYEWCRLDTCSSNATMPISSFRDLMRAVDTYYVKGSGDANYGSAAKALFGENGAGGITAADLYSYGFRRSVEGVPYNISDANFKTTILSDLEKAVKLVHPTSSDPEVNWATKDWADIQELILEAKGITVPAGTYFWWQPTDGAPNGTPPTPTTWADLLKYSFQAYVGVDTDGDGTPDAVVPDAFDNFTAEKVNKTRLDSMIKEDADGVATGEYADMGWLRKGVDADGIAIEFTDADDFAAEWAATLAVFKANGVDTVDKLKALSWEQLQYTLITKQFKSHNDILDETSGKVTGGPLEGKLLYWNDGGQPKLDYPTLLDAVNDFFFEADSTKLDTLLSKGINPINNEVYLRKDDVGAAFASADDFKDTVSLALMEAMMSASNMMDFVDTSTGSNKWTMTWHEFQWLLINYNRLPVLGELKDDTTIKAEHTADPTVNDYWWYDGGAPNGPMPLRSINELFTAYFWTVGTSTGVAGQNTAALDNLSADIMNNLKLRSHPWGTQYSDTLASSADLIAAVSAAMAKMPYLVSNLGTVSADDLALELQYLLLDPSASYKSAAAIKADSTLDYWWLTGDGSYPVPTTQEELLQAAWKAFEGNMNGKVPEAEEALKKLDIDWVSKRVGGLALRKNLKGENYDNINAFVNALREAAIELGTGTSYANLGNITQRQLQWLLLDNAYASNADVESATIDTSTDPATDAYWWFEHDKKPTTGGPTLEEKPLNESNVTWAEFIDALWTYALDYTEGPMEDMLNDYGLDLINKDFLLRKSINENDTFDSMEEFYDADNQWGDKLYDVLNEFFFVDRKTDFSTNANDFDIRIPTWDEFQYMFIHYDEISGSHTLPSLDIIEEEAHQKYTWRYKYVGGGEPEPVVTIKPLNENNVTWADFMAAAWTYAMDYDETDMSDILGVYDKELLNNDFLLRRNLAGDTFTDLETEFYDEGWGDALYDVINEFFFVDRKTDFSTNANDFDIRIPTWDEFQYMFIHYNEVHSSGVLPDEDTIRAEAEEKYFWRYEVSTPATPPPPKVEKQIDQSKVSWADFIAAAWTYALDFDETSMTDIFNDYGGTDLLNVDYLLRKNLDGDTFTDLETEFYDEGWGDPLYDVINEFFFVNRRGDFSTNANDFDIRIPTWYEFQYMIIHYNEISRSGILPSEAEIMAEVEEKYTWKYE